MTDDTTTPLLAVEGLSVEFTAGDSWLRVLDDVSFTIRRRQVLGLVGESGSGKTVASLAVMGLTDPVASRRLGRVMFDGRNLAELGEPALRDIRGRDIGMIFQEPSRSLNPAYTVGDQISEVLRRHRPGISRADAWKEAVAALDMVELPGAADRAHEYPYEFSGGMAQRAMIAMALVCRPKLLIADEPTTALDATIQQQILRLILSLRDELDLGVLLITHDLGVVAETCDDVNVMYAGQIVESARAADLFARPKHPYAEGLIGAIPRGKASVDELAAIPGRVPPPGSWPLGCRFANRCPYAVDACREKPIDLFPTPRGDVRCIRHDELELEGADFAALAVGARGASSARGSGELLVEAAGLGKTYPGPPSKRLFQRRPRKRVVSDVDLRMNAGETTAIVGESGAGKSTLGRLLLRLEQPDTGSLRFADTDVLALGAGALREWRPHAQMIFQDPFNSLNPRRTVGASVAEPLLVHGLASPAAARARVHELFEQVGLDPATAGRYPRDFSGGQLQRISIARALSTEPRLLVCDEPVAALDTSVSAQVLKLLVELQRTRDLAMAFITHDLTIVPLVAHRVVVMRGGRVVEAGTVAEVFDTPQSEYTEQLLAAIPGLARPGGAATGQGGIR